MNAHAHHVAAHELDVLEAFVHDCIQQLPRLQPLSAFANNAPASGSPIGSNHHSHNPHLPGRSATYHTTCSVMLKQALTVLSPQSPRLSRLIAQIWDLTSLNMFALLQLVHATLTENEALLAQCEHSANFEAERIEQEAERSTRIETEREQLRIEAQHLRAELQTTRQRANRLAVEKTQLRRVLNNLLDGALEPGSEGANSLSTGGSRVVNEFVEDVAAVGVAEEQELYGIDRDALDAMETAHPLERAAADLDHVLQALVDGEANHVAILNSMDRFVNSNAVGLLWRYGSVEEQHQLMERMTRMRHAGTQTIGEKGDYYGGRRNSMRTNPIMQGAGATSDTENNDSEEDSDGDIDNFDALAASGVSGHAEVVTHKRALPATLRAQLSSRPKIHRVLELRDVGQLILALYIEKLDLDAEDIRKKQTRLTLHPFMKQAFVERYGITSLADYHLMELVKSCLFHHEKYRNTINTPVSISSAGPTDSLLAMLMPTERPHQYDAVDVRVALFVRVCELVPFELSSGADSPSSPATSTVMAAGNLLTTCLHVLVDFLGDIVELDPSIARLNDVENMDGRKWWCPINRAALLLSQHLGHIGHEALAQVISRLTSLSGPNPDAELSSPDPRYRHSSESSVAEFDRIHSPAKDNVVAVDTLLTLFVVAWLEYDQRLTTKLRDGFRRQLMLTSPLALNQTASLTAKTQAQSSGNRGRRTTVVKPIDAEITVSSADIQSSPPIEILMRVFASIPDESISLRTLEELRSTFDILLATKSDQLQQQQQQQHQQPAKERGRRLTKRMQSSALLIGSSICIGGVSEKEFVFHALQVLRALRACCGVRTNSRRLVRPARPADLVQDENGELPVAIGAEKLNTTIWMDEGASEAFNPVALEALKPRLVRREW